MEIRTTIQADKVINYQTILANPISVTDDDSKLHTIPTFHTQQPPKLYNDLQRLHQSITPYH